MFEEGAAETPKRGRGRPVKAGREDRLYPGMPPDARANQLAKMRDRDRRCRTVRSGIGRVVSFRLPDERLAKAASVLPFQYKMPIGDLLCELLLAELDAFEQGKRRGRILSNVDKPFLEGQTQRRERMQWERNQARRAAVEAAREDAEQEDRDREGPDWVNP